MRPTSSPSNDSSARKSRVLKWRISITATPRCLKKPKPVNPPADFPAKCAAAAFTAATTSRPADGESKSKLPPVNMPLYKAYHSSEQNVFHHSAEGNDQNLQPIVSLV